MYDTLMRRSERYEQQMWAMLNRERAGQLMVIRPTNESIGHFEGDKAKVEAYYQHGYARMVKRLPELRTFMGVARENAEQVVG
ncbi:MAG: hypothetical protein IJX39_08255 [Clostridia bacterium]|nr:hypothetical protein [Clostridia bacterium]